MKEKFPVITGAESFFLKGNDIGLLLSHGFMGTPQSVQYIGEKLFHLGYTVCAPRLKGHGTHYKDLEKSSYQDWLLDLEINYKLLKETCSSIFVIGQSMGGTLALWMAKKYKDINGLVLINAALNVPNYEKWIGKTIPKYIHESEPDIKQENVYEITYNKVPIKSINQLQLLMEKTPEFLQAITNPTVCFKSAEDHVVPPENTDFIYQHISYIHKKVITLHNSYHVASMDNDKDNIVKYTHQFIQNTLEEKAVEL